MKLNNLSVVALQPYTFYYQGTSFFVFTALIFLMTLCFGYFFEPFIVYAPEHKMDYFFICILHAFTPVVVLFIMFFLSKLKSDIDEMWTLGKELLFVITFFFLVGMGQFFLRDVIYDNPNNWSWGYFLEEIRNTFLVGSLFFIILVSLNFNRLYQLNQKKATALLASVPQKTHVIRERNIFIKTQVRGDNFNLEIDRFLFARSEKNYVEIYLLGELTIEKTLKRITLKELTSKLNIYPAIIKTHRSFLVNLNQVENVTGNAQGFNLSLKEYPGNIPVSRSLIPEFEQEMQKL